MLSCYLATKLQQFVGSTSSYIKDSVDFIEKFRTILIDENDLLVSFDVVSLFTNIPVLEALHLISQLVDQETLNPIQICLNSTFLSFKGTIYEQTKGTIMGSPLSPIVANTFMEHFETRALNS